MKRRHLLLSAAIVLATALAGGAIAAYATAGDTVHACVRKSDGRVRIDDSCNSDETSRSWNVQGPAGPSGSAGPAGSAGPTGPSDSYMGWAEGDLALSKYWTAVSTPLTLPVGYYTITAHIDLSSYDTQLASQCKLFAGPQTDVARAIYTDSQADTLVMSVSVASLSSFNTYVKCYADHSPTYWSHLRIVAIRVGNAHSSHLQGLYVP